MTDKAQPIPFRECAQCQECAHRPRGVCSVFNKGPLTVLTNDGTCQAWADKLEDPTARRPSRVSKTWNSTGRRTNDRAVLRR